MSSESARFREPVELWKCTAKKNDPDPTDFARSAGGPLLAEIVDTKGGEVIRGRTIEAYVGALVTLRHSPLTGAIRGKDKLIGAGGPYGGVTFNVIACSIKRKRQMPFFVELDCTRDG